ncbi:MAG: trehalose-phosphatase [Rubrivivax sp.]
MNLPLNPPPLADRDSALFVDFDGTLVDLALTPDAVAVSAEVPDLLQRLRTLLDGAVAVVSGRPVAQIDRLLQPLKLCAAGVHGVERRGADGQLQRQVTVDLRPAATLVGSLVDAHPGLRLEQKDGAIALHYRLVPTLEPLCLHTMTQALAITRGMMLMHGKMVIEMKPQGTSKGLAVQAFMQEAPFLNRRAWFFGDDVTDESGFEAVLALGGVAVKIGAGPTLAPHRLADPAAVHRWLSSTAAHLSAPTRKATP